MARKRKQPTGPLFLGIEGGGTRTVAVMADGRGKLVRRMEAGPGNVRLLDDGQLLELFQGIAVALPRPDAVGIGMAGARAESDRRRMREVAGRVWGPIPCQATDDLETALSAGDEPEGGGNGVRVLVLSGTGSCCFGRDAKGRTAKVGGWGHVLGDGGSGYDIGLRVLRASVRHSDETGKWPVLGKQILRRLRVNEPNELIPWAQSAPKDKVAELAEEVFRAAAKGDRMAGVILAEAGKSLAQEALACASKLAKRGTRVEFVLTGGTLLKQPKFAAQLGARLRKLWPGAVVTPLRREGAWGAVAVARGIRRPLRTTQTFTAKALAKPAGASGFDWVKLAPTEQQNPRSANLDKMPLVKAIELMASEDAKIPRAILECRKEIARAVGLVAAAFKRGGRLFYVGAGTSGRLGVLDASECPPTFRTPPELVQGIMAGGAPALVRSVEGAEDDAEAGAGSIKLRKVNARDVVVGITASGRTPFVWGALDEAGRRGAKTVLLCFNPFKKIEGHRRPNLVIAPQVGPEILTGSTRLKAGTATKLILNMLTTLAMARTGRVVGNLMVDLNPSNAKLRDRAVRIVRELCGVDDAKARRTLESCGWVVQRACAKLGRN
ncbi:MAG TPA: N-acetylmuramic acid 6-phosphate etherase [Verrucomicrobiae bacterium]|jgi:N-acetylmuramic acid 6-phosphate etherase|nr:N-acetylmuramic acid 6-phosphate etherase [Verrucomicrobiae bacterium]